MLAGFRLPSACASGLRTVVVAVAVAADDRGAGTGAGAGPGPGPGPGFVVLRKSAPTLLVAFVDKRVAQSNLGPRPCHFVCR